MEKFDVLVFDSKVNSDSPYKKYQVESDSFLNAAKQMELIYVNSKGLNSEDICKYAHNWHEDYINDNVRSYLKFNLEGMVYGDFIEVHKLSQ